MTFDIYQGDPRIIIDENGSDLLFRGGQPVMDQGLENAAIISWFTNEGWWGNDLFSNTDQHIGSSFEQVAQQSITLSALISVQNAGKSALQWMIDTEVAKDVEVLAKNPEGRNLEVKGTIEPPGRDTQTLLAKKHGANWLAQKKNPANERL